MQDLRPLCSLSCKRVATVAITVDMMVAIAEIGVVNVAEDNPQNERQSLPDTPRPTGRSRLIWQRPSQIRTGPVGIRASFARKWTTSAWLRTIPRRIGPKAGQSIHTCKVEDTKARPPLRTLTVKCLVLGSDAEIPDQTPHAPLVEKACTAYTLMGNPNVSVAR